MSSLENKTSAAEVRSESEQDRRSKKSVTNAEALASLELTKAILEGIDETQHEEIKQRLLSEFTMQTEKQTEQLTRDKEALYEELIKEGFTSYEKRRGLITSNELLAEEEKKKQLNQLEYDYKMALILQRTVRAQAAESLLANLLNPYLWTPESVNAYEYDLGFETATVKEEIENSQGDVIATWKSRWDPSIHFSKRLGRFMSQNDVDKIRSMLVKFFQSRERAMKIKSEVEEILGRKVSKGFDPQAGQLFLEKILGIKYQLQDKNHIQVSFGVTSINIVLSKADYIAIRLEKGSSSGHLSGGCHFPNTPLNLIANWDVDGTIAHEEEHGFNDFILNMNDQGVHDVLRKHVPEKLLQANCEPEEAASILKNIVTNVFPHLLGDDFVFTRFADEVLANKMEPSQTKEDDYIFKALTESQLYNYLQLTDSIIKELTDRFISVLIRRISYMTPYQQRGVLLQRLSQILTPDFVRPWINRDFLDRRRLRMIQAVSSLQRQGYTANQIRGLLATENPLLWEEIVSASVIGDRKFIDVLSRSKVAVAQEQKNQVTLGKHRLDRAAELIAREKKAAADPDVQEVIAGADLKPIVDMLLQSGYRLSDAVKSVYESDEQSFSEYFLTYSKIIGDVKHDIQINRILTYQKTELIKPANQELYVYLEKRKLSARGSLQIQGKTELINLDTESDRNLLPELVNQWERQ